MIFGGSINWAIEVWEDWRDFLIGDTSTLPTLDKQNTKIYTYNQGHSKDCTLYSAIWAISDLKDYKFSSQEIKEIVKKSYEMGRRKGKGWYSQMWVKCVSQWWNAKFPDNKVLYYSLWLDSDEANDALNKNYTLCVTYRGNRKYWLDYLTDAILDWYEFGKKTYWHATNIIKRNNKAFVKDSYKGRKGKGWISCNIYELKSTFKQLIQSTYYPTAYLIVNAPHKDKEQEIKRLYEMQEIIEDNMEDNSELWNRTKDWNYKNALHNMNNIHRNKLLDIEKEINKFS